MSELTQTHTIYDSNGTRSFEDNDLLVNLAHAQK